MPPPIRLIWLAPLLWPLTATAQAQPDLTRILERLDRLERENRELTAEVRALRAEIQARGDAAPAASTAARDAAATTEREPSTEERLRVQERRVEEQAQTKVEAASRFPIRLTGMALFNAFLNSRQNGGSDYPLIASEPGEGRAGATVRQTILGLDFRGPQTLWGGTVHGSVYMDFFTGTTIRDQALRVRTASIELAWKTRSVAMGLEKPIFNPREPSSLAQVGVSPLTGAGNLWLWLPQIRVQQDFAIGPNTGFRARLGAVATREVGPYAGSDPDARVEASRPALEGRVEWFYRLDDERRLEFASGFHVSTTHVAGQSVPSNLYSLDWFFNPIRRVELTGTFYSGQNVAHLGTGGIRQGYAVYYGRVRPVRGRGGWAQSTFHLTPRLDMHVFSGQQDDRNGDLGAANIGKNLVFGANLFLRLAPNLILAPELSQLRTVYIGQGTRINNHYDLALGYSF